MELLDEARDRALIQICSRMDQNEDIEYQEGEKEAIAEIIGMSSVKYYELKQNRISDYVFSYDKILDPKGNTGVYLLYMYVRICSILRKGHVKHLMNLYTLLFQYDLETVKNLIMTNDINFTSEYEIRLA